MGKKTPNNSIHTDRLFVPLIRKHVRFLEEQSRRENVFNPVKS